MPATPPSLSPGEGATGSPSPGDMKEMTISILSEILQPVYRLSSYPCVILAHFSPYGP